MDTVQVDYDFALELFEKADMYRNKCSQQEEKFNHYRQNYFDFELWTWQDCEAAYNLVRENYYMYYAFYRWRRGML